MSDRVFHLTLAGDAATCPGKGAEPVRIDLIPAIGALAEGPLVDSRERIYHVGQVRLNVPAQERGQLLLEELGGHVGVVGAGAIGSAAGRALRLSEEPFAATQRRGLLQEARSL